MGREEDRLLVQPRAVGGEIRDPFQPRIVGQRPEVDLAEDVGREDVGDDGLGGLEL